ncbi:NAD(P)H oxidoreductase [Streptomyces sp. NPDC058657]|uniref:NAD(P)H oxidoreductase n=1 Tax=unclassified Streptomyces TaxID=2593676 RepID=UPI0036497024
MSHTLLVVAHPRTDSLTGQAAARARQQLEAAGHTVDLLDLHAEGFDPRMTQADEPDWSDPHKTYSPEVRAHMRRIEAAGTVVVVFPLWWYAMPALLKGWFDRVWNNGFAYGNPADRTPFSGKRMLWTVLAGAGAEDLSKPGFDDAIERLLRAGISEYTGMTDVTLEFVYETVVADAAGARRVLDDADTALADFLAAPGARTP